MKPRNFHALVAFSAGFAAAFAQSAPFTVVREVVGPAYTPGTVYTLSARGMHLATTQPRGDKFVVTLDGADGPAFDEILRVVPTFETEYDSAGIILEQSVPRQGPVALSPDGQRQAYAGRIGAEVVLMVDGKELLRAPYSQAAPPVSLLQFTPDGRHVFYFRQTADTLRSFELVMDGKAVTPPFDGTPQPLFSADGSHWLLSSGKAKNPAERLLVVDGKEAGYAGQRVRFSPDGKHVVCVAANERGHQLLVDGKVTLTAPFIERFKVSATNVVAAIVRPSAGTGDVFKQTLYVDGKLVPESVGAADVVFSPDGRHWAARLQRDMATVAWVIADGKKHKDYAWVGDLTFSPDSTVLAYQARTATTHHIVTNGEEGEGNGLIRSRPTFAQTGNKFVYAAGREPLALKLYADGKPSPVHRNVFRLALSPDGNRVAYFAGVDATTTEFIVDGQVVTHDGGFGGTAVFSPDSQHLAAGTRKPGGYGTIYVDGEFLPERLGLGVPKEFTPDSRHLLSVGAGDPAIQRGVGPRYFLDGELVAEFSGRSMPFENSPKMVRNAAESAVLPFGVSSVEPDPNAKPWEFGADGSVIFIGPAVDPAGSGPMTRVVAKPAPEATIATWLAAVKVNEAKALADAEAARKHAEEAKAAAAAKAKADAEAAAAKRKADYEAAVEAKRKARQDALDAKAKAKRGEK